MDKVDLIVVGYNLKDSILFNVLYNVIEIGESEVKVLSYAKEETLSKRNKKSIVEAIEYHRPKCVITLGNIMSKGLYKFKSGITTYRGRVAIEKDFSIVPTFSPEYIRNNEASLEVWAQDIQKAYNLSKGIVEGKTKVVYCDTVDKVKQAVKYCKQTGVACFDFETVAIDKKKGVLAENFYATTLSISFQIGSAYVIPLEHKESPYSIEEVRTIMQYLKSEIFENPDIRKIAHNLNFDYHVLAIYGTDKLIGRIDDTMLMSHLHNELDKGGLKYLVAKYFTEFEGYGEGLSQAEWADIPINILSQYNGTDTDMTLRLCVLLESYLQKDEPVYKIYRNLSMAVFRPLWEAERMGMLIDHNKLSSYVEEVEGLIEKRLDKLRSYKTVKRFEISKEKELRDNEIEATRVKLSKRVETSNELAKEKHGKSDSDKSLSDFYEETKTEKDYRIKIRGLKLGEGSIYEGINFNSPKQLADLLYKNEGGFKFSAYETSTAKDTLKLLEDSTGFIEDLLALKSMNKIQSTYLKGILDRLDRNNRVHTHFKINGAVTGRLSSVSPNLQNIVNPASVKDEALARVARMVKDVFVPPENHTLVQLDYSQVELRVIASFANEVNMLSIYRDDGDIHSATAANLAGIELKDFDRSKEKDALLRQHAKAVNFGFIYGMSADRFKQYAKDKYNLILTLTEAINVRDNFFLLYPKLKDYYATYITKASKYGWIRTMFGRRRRTPDINSEDDYLRSMDERVCINSPIQGTAGELTIFAIALLYLRLPETYQNINTVHDSIMYYVPNECVDEAIGSIQQTMENLPTEKYFGGSLKVGLKAEADTTEVSWAEL